MSGAAPSDARRTAVTPGASGAVLGSVTAEATLEERERALQLAELFLARTPEDLIRTRAPQALARTVLGVLRFLDRSGPGRVGVEVFNPDVSSEGWSEPVTVLRTHVGERPFVVDSIRELLHGRGLAILRMVYPIVEVERDVRGRPVRFGPASDRGANESIVHAEIERIEDPDRLSDLREGVARALEDVVRATDDFTAMVDGLNWVVAELAEVAKVVPGRGPELSEVQDFLRWLRDGGFVFLGSRSYDLVDLPDGERGVAVERGSGRGILRDEASSRYAGAVPLSALDPELRTLIESGPVLIVSKTKAESMVHRRARMDYVGIKRFDRSGRIIGEHRFLGLFTSKAYAQPAEEIPILRRKLAGVLEAAAIRPGAHDYKEYITIFNSMPKEELFLASTEEIGIEIRTVLTSYNTDQVRVTVRPDPLGRGIAVMVILPKDLFSGEVRKEIESELVETFGAEVLNYHLALGAGDQARLHFHLAAPASRLAQVDGLALERTIVRITRSWSDRLEEALGRRVAPARARELAARYGLTASPEYRAVTDPEIAAEDVLQVEAMAAEGRDVAVVLGDGREPHPTGETTSELKVILRGTRLVLSEFMPLLDHLGLRVLDVRPFRIDDDAPGASIHVFQIQDGEGRPLDLAACGSQLAECLLAVWAGDGLSDALNALVVTAGLRWREVDVLRAYVGYAFQLRAVPSRMALPSALRRYPQVARELFELFEARFDPAVAVAAEERRVGVARRRTRLRASMKQVGALMDDRALRRLEQIICATVRTNYYRHGGAEPSFRSGGVPYLSLKIHCADLEFARADRLLFEVWVHSARMEGIHLRGARVARGGIRWSDRPDDFRIEVLGLVKTQMVKNAVIVPGGSKGGFVLRHGPADAGARAEEGRRQYATLMRGLLDLTDNLDESGSPRTPRGVIPHDPPDPYLVVAADKGTATFSDLANAIAAEYAYWLGDAFASGGSNGYDHKAVGITARGAWECVRRHFAEMGRDVGNDPFTVIGIGDMGGDVFGNGMLRSERIRLVAAFDHRHVFIDPNPDPEVAYAERARLFGLPRSSWDDYDRSALSPGGAILARDAKEVSLTPEARIALGIGPDERVEDGEALVRKVLAAPVDLLWNGGIGTYVKASEEGQADAGDPANDAVRVDAAELRCRVIGEGGNLGLTQRARVEFALRGGRIDTDALDNSGGVDMSDHEVNLKILLAPAVAAGRIDAASRNRILGELTDTVADLVLADNRTQSLAVSLDEARSAISPDDFRDLMFALEKGGELDRTSAALPTLDVLEERRASGAALTRPELCVLLARAKLSLKTRLLSSTLPDEPAAERYLVAYFPPDATMVAGREVVAAHRLRREIIASQLTNDLVDLMGASFVAAVTRDTGNDAVEVARAWMVAARLADHGSLLARLGDADAGRDPGAARGWILGLAGVLDRATRWVLRNVPKGVAADAFIDEHLEGLSVLLQGFRGLASGEELARFEGGVRELMTHGCEESVAVRLVALRSLDQLLEVLEIAGAEGVPDGVAAAEYYHVLEALELTWLRRAIQGAAGDGSWERRAAQALLTDVSEAHRRIVAARVKGGVEMDGPGGLAGAAATRFRGLVAEVRDEGTSPSLTALSLVCRSLAELAEGSR